MVALGVDDGDDMDESVGALLETIKEVAMTGWIVLARAAALGRRSRQHTELEIGVFILACLQLKARNCACSLILISKKESRSYLKLFGRRKTIDCSGSGPFVQQFLILSRPPLSCNESGVGAMVDPVPSRGHDKPSEGGKESISFESSNRSSLG